jgi:hypothetical protein
MKIRDRWFDSIICEGKTFALAIANAPRTVNDGAFLRDADLRDAVLRGADLRGADLRGADLSDANLSDANLSDAVLRDADLSGAVLRGADLRGAPSLPDLDKQILGIIEQTPSLFDMSTWHGETNSPSCGTTHCFAGWAITLAGERGKELEAEIGPAAAGALIFAASVQYVPPFYSTNEEAIEFLRNKIAEREAAASK